MNSTAIFKPMSKTTFALIAAGAFLSCAACSSTSSTPPPAPRVAAVQVRMNPTPRLQSLTRSYEENLNLFARTQDNRWRGIHDDFQTIFFLNRNTGLTEYEHPLR